MITQIYFYHIPKFLKNSSGAKTRNQYAPSGTDSFLCFQRFRVNGGAKRDRTADLLRAKQALSQLSYGPIYRSATSHDNWWVWADSNCRPHPYQGCALTN
jgi:hypothetical protein